MNIAMISTWKQRCGIATYTCNLANALKEDVNVYIVRLPRFGIYKEPSIFMNIAESIPLDEIDLIHCQHEYGLFGALNKMFFPALKKLNKPLVTTMHAVGTWGEDMGIGETSDKIIVHNEFCRDRFAGDQSKVSIIPHGMTPLRTPLPPKDMCKKRLGIQPEVPIVGYLGYISNYKGIEWLIEAMVDVPKAGLLMGGGWFTDQETEYIVNLREQTAKLLPSRCQWIGYVADENLAMTYGAMDLLVYPSRFMTESGAMLMALSHGKAVIASDLPPVREKAKKGALMTFKDTKDLAEKIKLLIADEALRKQLEDGARRFAEENSWANVAKQHVALYRDTLHV